uniref:NADH-ubiquinone oxidoreductase chain 5 n=1 Tax=Thalassina kelanang TaxID=1114971 RepID=K4F1C0_THAKE|nr:NADH dehydrogenase subunit 5 [Thalassina kelanang]AEW68304.1 NADH dehydrogenase subunit 5 [Thalassina kelanang]
MWWKFSMHLVSMLTLLGFSLFFFFMSLSFLMGEVVVVVDWNMITLNSSNIVMSLIFDWMSFMFLSLVLFISSMVLYYSGGYMEGDLNFNRFMFLVLLFVFSMSALIVSPNLISILLGWDGLGLVSYALVIYYQNEKSANAGMLTVLSNRVGDVAILLSIALMYDLGGWNFIYYVMGLSDIGAEGALKWLVILAAMTKSAQIPFSAWLPAAMAAPTPVSALVHSSTLVTAGVYLLIRFSPAFICSKVLGVLMLVSCLTMFMAGLGANFEYDLKKIIALSTLSQLGVMISAISLGLAGLAFFHLLTHALFKALLFMCAGVVIHNVGEYQDIRMMGGLCYFMPSTSMFMNLANLSLCGTPFLAGFYSKDLILEAAFMSSLNFIIFLLYFLSTGLTVSYTFRLIYYSLTGNFNLGVVGSLGDNSNLMVNSMKGLCMGALVGGCVLSWLIFPEPLMICLSLSMKILPLLVSVAGALIGYLLNILSVTSKLNSLFMYKFVVVAGSMWFMPFISTFKGTLISLGVGLNMFKVSDKGWSEYYGGQGFFELMVDFSSGLQLMSESSIKLLMKSFFVFVVIVMFIF